MTEDDIQLLYEYNRVAGCHGLCDHRNRGLWIGLSRWTVAAQTLRVLNQLLIVLMLVEILHTVRISIRSHVLVIEPFLIVGLIASIRRVLVITLEAATLTKEGAWATEGSSAIFHS